AARGGNRGPGVRASREARHRRGPPRSASRRRAPRARAPRHTRAPRWCPAGRDRSAMTFARAGLPALLAIFVLAQAPDARAVELPPSCADAGPADTTTPIPDLKKK